MSVLEAAVVVYAEPSVARVCDVCGGGLGPGNMSGVCSRTSACLMERGVRYYANNRDRLLEARAKWRAANRTKTNLRARKYRAVNPEKARKSCRDYYAANREVISQRARKYCAVNREALSKRSRDYYAANKEKCREYHAKKYAANRKRISQRAAEYRDRNREKIRKRGREYRAANLEKCRERSLEDGRMKRFVAGALPQTMNHGYLHHAFRGGREVRCVVCGERAGWRAPGDIKTNKTGFRCREHHYTILRESNDEG